MYGNNHIYIYICVCVLANLDNTDLISEIKISSYHVRYSSLSTRFILWSPIVSSAPPEPYDLTITGGGDLVSSHEEKCFYPMWHIGTPHATRPRREAGCRVCWATAPCRPACESTRVLTRPAWRAPSPAGQGRGDAVASLCVSVGALVCVYAFVACALCLSMRVSLYYRPDWHLELIRNGV